MLVLVPNQIINQSHRFSSYKTRKGSGQVEHTWRHKQLEERANENNKKEQEARKKS
jgi:hypothetical protein